MTSSSKSASRIPVTILTGFLGSGKTTLLNKILQSQHTKKIAVIENEFGEVGVDNEIVLATNGEQIVQMNNGCICCNVRGDLVPMLMQLRAQSNETLGSIEHVIIETTGLADPAPVAQTFFIDNDVAQNYRLDSIITIVDAKHAHTQLDDFIEAQEQIGYADRILISKSDLVDSKHYETLRKRLIKINPRASLTNVNFGETSIDDLISIKGFSLNSILELEPDFLKEEEHEHEDTVQSFVFQTVKQIDQDKLQKFFSTIIELNSHNLMRYKGIVSFEEFDYKVIIQGVHMIMGSDVGPLWKSNEVRESKLVFIGRNLPREEMIRSLEDCLIS